MKRFCKMPCGATRALLEMRKSRRYGNLKSRDSGYARKASGIQKKEGLEEKRE